jgi:RNA polymerase sporulation-specific sigma factor
MVTIEEAQQSKEKMDIFIEENMGLVGKAIRQLHLPHIDDYVQEGAIGLLKAARRFDLSYGVQFSTYAIPMIIGEIKRHIRDYESLNLIGGLRVSREIKQIFFKSLKYQGYEDSVICKELNITQEQLDEARIAMSTCKWLDADAHSEDNGDAPITLHSIVPCAYNLEEEATDKIFLEEIKNIAEKKCGENAGRVVDLYSKGLTQEEVSKVVGISQVQVSRTFKKIGRKVFNVKGVERMRERKITPEQLLDECREHGTGKEAVEIIAQKYDMAISSVRQAIYKNHIKSKLMATSQEDIKPENNQSTEPIMQPEQKPCLLKPKAWSGKENTYSIENGLLIIANKEGALPVQDIWTMIQELQELAEKAV